MLNCLNPDQDRCSVGPDLGPNCLQRSSADDKSCRYQGKSLYDHLLVYCQYKRKIQEICKIPQTNDI